MKTRILKNVTIITFSIIVLLTTVLFISCNKEGVVEVDLLKNNIDFSEVLYIDDVEVPANNFNSEIENMFLIEIHKPLKNHKQVSDIVLIEKRAYSTEEEYIEFGKRHGYDFETQLLFERIMSRYAENSGVIVYYEQTGKIPIHYVEREQVVYDSLFLDTQLRASLFITLFEKHFVQGQGAGKSIIMAATLAFMPTGWSNRVSCVEFVGVGGGVHIYSSTFYRNRVATVINWGMTHINLYGTANNSMSSGLRFL